MLTNAVAKAAMPQARAYKLFDHGGLFMHVATSGTKSWRMKFRMHGQEQLLVLGRFPDMPLPVARSRRDAVRVKLAQGQDPRGAGIDAAATFAGLVRSWHAHMAPRWSAAHSADVQAAFERDVFPAIGNQLVDTIAPKQLLAILRSIEGRGSRATARRMRQRLSAVFGFGISLEQCTQDPAAMLGRALSGAELVKPHAALTAIEDCRALIADYRILTGQRSVQLASDFLALTAVRLAAVRGARWEEFEGLDGIEPVWRVPAARMKLARKKKGDDRFAHLVPLSPAALAVLGKAKKLRNNAISQFAHSDLVFPGRSGGSPIGEGAIRALYIEAGYARRHVPHGWRSSFSTILNEQLGQDWRADIDRALAHTGRDKVEAAYNRAQLLPRRRELFNRWGALLTG